VTGGMVIGIDAGQSGTRSIAVDRTGHTLGRGGAAGVQHLAVADSAERTATSIADAYFAVAHGHEIPAAVGIGISGWSDDPTITQLLVALTAGRCRAARLVLASDALTSFVGAAGRRAGVVVAAGTGAVALAADAKGRWARSDGLGSLLGDRGSGYWIGREGLAQAIRDDDRGRPTPLQTTAEARFGRLARLVDSLQRDVHPVARIAAFARDVAVLANAGDRAAATIYARAGRELGDSAAAAADRVFPAKHAVCITLTGGLAESSALLLPAALARIERRRPGSTCRAVPHGSLLGALRLARDPALAGWFPGGLLERGA
jgi:glucosamine kinase